MGKKGCSVLTSKEATTKKKYKISIPFYVVLVISDVCAEEIYFASTTAYYFYYYPYVKTSAQS
jgi:hypothetical protein